MDFGGPQFVLAIIGMAMFAGVLKTAVRAKHGVPDNDTHGHRKHGRMRDPHQAETIATLRLENRQLREKLEMHENRLISLERIVTDPGYDVARQIEALRHETTPLVMPTARMGDKVQ